LRNRSDFTGQFVLSTFFSAGLEAQLYVSQDGWRYSFQTRCEDYFNRSKHKSSPVDLTP
jgi:hypothetical protein